MPDLIKLDERALEAARLRWAEISPTAAEQFKDYKPGFDVAPPYAVILSELISTYLKVVKI